MNGYPNVVYACVSGGATCGVHGDHWLGGSWPSAGSHLTRILPSFNFVAIPPLIALATAI